MSDWRWTVWTLFMLPWNFQEYLTFCFRQSAFGIWVFPNRSKSMEQSAANCNVAHRFPMRTEDIHTPFKLCRPLSRLSSLYTVSAHSWQCHSNSTFYVIMFLLLLLEIWTTWRCPQVRSDCQELESSDGHVLFTRPHMTRDIAIWNRNGGGFGCCAWVNVPSAQCG